MFTWIKSILFKKNHKPSAQRDIGVTALRNYILGGFVAVLWIGFISINMPDMTDAVVQEIKRQEGTEQTARRRSSHEVIKDDIDLWSGYRFGDTQKERSKESATSSAKREHVVTWHRSEAEKKRLLARGTGQDVSDGRVSVLNGQYGFNVFKRGDTLTLYPSWQTPKSFSTDDGYRTVPAITVSIRESKLKLKLQLFMQLAWGEIDQYFYDYSNFPAFLKHMDETFKRRYDGFSVVELSAGHCFTGGGKQMPCGKDFREWLKRIVFDAPNPNLVDFDNAESRVAVASDSAPVESKGFETAYPDMFSGLEYE